jgi:hypothetical protein
MSTIVNNNNTHQFMPSNPWSDGKLPSSLRTKSNSRLTATDLKYNLEILSGKVAYPTGYKIQPSDINEISREFLEILAEQVFELDQKNTALHEGIIHQLYDHLVSVATRVYRCFENLLEVKENSCESNDKPAPLVGMPISPLLAEEHASNQTETVFTRIGENYSIILKVRSDGHCLFRSVATAFFYRFQTATTEERVALIDRFETLKNEFPEMRNELEGAILLLEYFKALLDTADPIQKNATKNEELIARLLSQAQDCIEKGSLYSIAGLGVGAVHENYKKIAKDIYLVDRNDKSQLTELNSRIKCLSEFNLDSILNNKKFFGLTGLCDLYKYLRRLFEQELSYKVSQVPVHPYLIKMMNDPKVSSSIVYCLRKLACEYNRSNRNDTLENMVASESNGYSFEEYLRDLSDMDLALCGGNAELHALSQVLGLKIKVIDISVQNRPEIFANSFDSEAPATHSLNTEGINLLFRPGHYDCLAL